MELQNKNIDKYLEYVMRSGRRTRLGFAEWIVIAVSGMIDGRRKAIRQTASGEWISSFVQKEKDACQEAQERLMGTVEQALQESYRNAEVLAAEMIFQKKQIEEHSHRLQPVPNKEQLSVRKKGEEGLSDSQINSRRSNEVSRINAEWTSKIRMAEATIERNFKELMGLKSYISHINSLTETAAEAIQSHTRQRVDYYWTVAVRTDKQAAYPIVYEGFAMKDIFVSFMERYRVKEAQLEKILLAFGSNKEVA